MLDEKQLEKLRNEIVLGSLYTQDYENTIGVCPINAQDFFDSYIEFKWEDAEEYGLEAVEDVEGYDTPSDLHDYYFYYYEDDPLPIDEIYLYMIENRIPFTIERYKSLCSQRDVILGE